MLKNIETRTIQCFFKEMVHMFIYKWTYDFCFKTVLQIVVDPKYNN